MKRRARLLVERSQFLQMKLQGTLQMTCGSVSSWELLKLKALWVTVQSLCPFEWAD